MYLATGTSLATSKANPVLITKITINKKSKWVQFGPDDNKNTLKTYDYILPFRINAAQSEGGDVKYVNWGTLQQDPYAEYGNMPLTPVYIYDVEDYKDCSVNACTTLQGEMYVTERNISVYNNTVSSPVYVTISAPPSEEVRLTLTVDTSCCAAEGEEIPNDPSVVDLNKEYLLYVPWNN